MQNAQIWKSIEALCNEAESVIKNGESVIEVIQSIAPPPLVKMRKSKADTITILPSEPAPPKAHIRIKSLPKENVLDNPLSPATMAEIAEAIDRASQTAQKPQIIDKPSQPVPDQLRKDLMIEVNLAVRSVLANELPKMVHHSISESLNEFINPTADASVNNLGALYTKPRLRGGEKKVSSENKSVPIKAAELEGMSKRELEHLGREYGVELDRRYKKSTLIKQIKNIIQHSGLSE